MTSAPSKHRPDSQSARPSRLALVCDARIPGRITDIACDERPVLVARPDLDADADSERIHGRMLSRFVAPGGIQHLSHLLAHVAKHGQVCEWLLDLRSAAGPVPYRLWVAQDDEALLVVGSADTEASFAGIAAAVAPAVAAVSAPSAAALLERLRRRADDPLALLDDLRAQTRGLHGQVQPPPNLNNRLLRMAAHDLRNPLLVLSIGCSFLLADADGLSEEHRSLLQENLDTCDFMNRLIDGIVDLAEVSSGHLQLQRAPADLYRLLVSAVERHGSLARERGSTLTCAPTSDAVHLPVDEGRISQVFGQLISNALLHCPPGTKVHVDIACGEREVTVTVSDDGPGIPTAVRERLFRPFGKPHGEVAPKHYGAGVGLAVARRIVEGHDGCLDLISSADAGTRFRVRLPRT